MPIYEFECRSCGQRFEELVGSHVGRETDDARCPVCGATEAERVLTSTYAPIPRQMTSGQRRRLEGERGIDRGGAKERFNRQRAAEKRAARRESR